MYDVQVKARKAVMENRGQTYFGLFVSNVRGYDVIACYVETDYCRRIHAMYLYVEHVRRLERKYII